MAKITGTSHQDVLTGTAHKDLILGFGDVDSLLGGGGNDTIKGAGGSDTISGGAGNDIVFGGGGNDKIKGGNGDDTLFGGNGKDTIKGGHGNDTIFGDAGNDKLQGDDGNDIIHGGIGDDVVHAGIGSDTIFDDAGDDNLNGGDGDDFFVAGEGHDIFNGEAGIDTVSYANSNIWVDVFLTTGDGVGGAQLDTLTSIENVEGTAFSDKLEGDGNANTLRGLGEKDYIHGGGGNDILEGGDGDDLLWGEAGGDAFFGGNGVDWVIYADETSGVTVNLTSGVGGGAAAGDTFHDIEVVEGTQLVDNITGDTGDNTLFGLEGADTLSGAGGNDTIFGADGGDTLNGGPGDDRLVPEGNNLGTETDHLDGGTGTEDWVDYNNAGSGVTVNLTTNANGGGFAAGDTYTGIENVAGSGFGDILTPAPSGRAFGDGGNDTIHDSTGTEFLRGGRGTDTLDDNLGAGGDDGNTDVFVLEAGLDSDNIFGFTPGQDRFALPEAMFGALPRNAPGSNVLAAAAYFEGANFGSWSPPANSAQLFHDMATDKLWFDDGFGNIIQIALLADLGAGLVVKGDFLIMPGF